MAAGVLLPACYPFSALFLAVSLIALRFFDDIWDCHFIGREHISLPGI